MTIKELRTEKKLSQAAFAESIGVSASTIGDIERGRTKVSPKVAEAVNRSRRGGGKSESKSRRRRETGQREDREKGRSPEEDGKDRRRNKEEGSAEEDKGR